MRRNWNRHALLTAWSTYLIVAAWGGTKDNFEEFVRKYPPPGYDPKA